MNAKLIWFALAISSIGLSCLHCGERLADGLYDEVNTYPLTPGSTWEYANFSSVIYRQNTLPPDLDTTRSTVVIECTDTVLGIQNAVIALYTQYPIDERFPVKIRKWLAFEGNLLQEFARQHINVDHVPILYDQPTVLLDFPLDDGKMWTSSREWMNYYSDYFVTRRYVAGTGIAVTPEGSFDCYIVSIRTTLERSDSLIISWDEWYANEGLIQKVYPVAVRYIRDEHGAILDTCEYSFKSELSHIHIE